MLTMAMLHDAQRVLSGVINKTPVIPSTGITQDCRLFLKADCLQKTGAFKLRGAYYKIATLSDEEKARGVISVLSNVAPRQVHDMCAAFKAGDVAKARQMQIDAIPLIEALFCEVNPIPVKEAMNMMGEEVGPFRKPLVDMEPANRDRLRRELVNYGISLKE